MAAKIMIGLNTTWNIVNFRAGLIRALIAQGYDVVGLAPPDRYVERLQALGCRHVPIEMAGQGVRPDREALLVARYLAAMRRERPDVYLGYTVKPNLYGSLAAHLLGIPVINNVTGLGATFIRSSWVTRVVRLMYRLALARSVCVFFQNEEDRALFVGARLVRAASTDVVPGSGVDLRRFRPAPITPATPDRPFRFLMIARLLRDKGVREYVDAARRLRASGRPIEVRLLGGLDPSNPDSIGRAELEAWIRADLIRYIAPTDHVENEIMDADCVVLPSYREGVPRTLLEAAAMARPLIATDVTGCREVVEHGVNGLLCKPRDGEDLAARMLEMASLGADTRAAMARAARTKVEREFDERIVIGRYLEVIGRLLTPRQLDIAGARS